MYKKGLLHEIKIDPYFKKPSTYFKKTGGSSGFTSDKEYLKGKAKGVIAKVKKGISNFKFNRRKPKVEASVTRQKQTGRGKLNTYQKNNAVDDNARSMEAKVQGDKWGAKHTGLTKNASISLGGAQADVNQATNAAIDSRNAKAEKYMRTDPRRKVGGLRRK
tara:strand:- start:690 stop:1175 length:486 start_codon:yes stop_codon:yes gene_type:complete